MDALALLCTLHADGPTTLGALRQQGCHALDDLQDLDPDLLERTLGGGARRVARFLSEARALEQRLGEDWPEEERGLEAGFPEAARVASEQAGGEAAGRPVIEGVLDQWRRRDASAPQAPQGDPDMVPRPTPATAGPPETLLRLAQLDGLDAGLLDQLEGEQVFSVEDLVEADMLVLAASCGQQYTKLLRLQFMAKRVLSDLPQPEQEQPESGSSPSAALPAAPTEDGAGGPFA